ncbi:MULTISPECIES: hypothetical protein [Chroococcidiopsis]|uniref:hypothetical protein n=1 Tax=Chroococcidiopsis TaxID=54298 RepID=UPI0002D547A4|nr:MULTISPECIES: hypothetical protein [Chroococcidiopsis]MBE9020047.1 hypothetical protein [Chroococcidiopsidales cyanobacterium LEGE 13417]
MLVPFVRERSSDRAIEQGRRELRKHKVAEGARTVNQQLPITHYHAPASSANDS